jgi:hypothetical protein
MVKAHLQEADNAVKEAIANAHELCQALLLGKAASDPNPNTAAVLRRIQQHEAMKADWRCINAYF